MACTFSQSTEETPQYDLQELYQAINLTFDMGISFFPLLKNYNFLLTAPRGRAIVKESNSNSLSHCLEIPSIEVRRSDRVLQYAAIIEDIDDSIKNFTNLIIDQTIPPQSELKYLNEYAETIKHLEANITEFQQITNGIIIPQINIDILNARINLLRAYRNLRILNFKKKYRDSHLVNTSELNCLKTYDLTLTLQDLRSLDKFHPTTYPCEQSFIYILINQTLILKLVRANYEEKSVLLTELIANLHATALIASDELLSDRLSTTLRELSQEKLLLNNLLNALLKDGCLEAHPQSKDLIQEALRKITPRRKKKTTSPLPPPPHEEDTRPIGELLARLEDKHQSTLEKPKKTKHKKEKHKKPSAIAPSTKTSEKKAEATTAKSKPKTKSNKITTEKTPVVPSPVKTSEKKLKKMESEVKATDTSEQTPFTKVKRTKTKTTSKQPAAKVEHMKNSGSSPTFFQSPTQTIKPIVKQDILPEESKPTAIKTEAITPTITIKDQAVKQEAKDKTSSVIPKMSYSVVCKVLSCQNIVKQLSSENLQTLLKLESIAEKLKTSQYSMAITGGFVRTLALGIQKHKSDIDAVFFTTGNLTTATKDIATTLQQCGFECRESDRPGLLRCTRDGQPYDFQVTQQSADVNSVYSLSNYCLNTDKLYLWLTPNTPSLGQEEGNSFWQKSFTISTAEKTRELILTGPGNAADFIAFINGEIKFITSAQEILEHNPIEFLRQILKLNYYDAIPQDGRELSDLVICPTNYLQCIEKQIQVPYLISTIGRIINEIGHKKGLEILDQLRLTQEQDNGEYTSFIQEIFPEFSDTQSTISAFARHQLLSHEGQLSLAKMMAIFLFPKIYCDAFASLSQETLSKLAMSLIWNPGCRNSIENTKYRITTLVNLLAIFLSSQPFAAIVITTEMATEWIGSQFKSTSQSYQDFMQAINTMKTARWRCDHLCESAKINVEKFYHKGESEKIRSVIDGVLPLAIQFESKYIQCQSEKQLASELTNTHP